MFGNLTGFMSNDQVATDTAALQTYIEQMKTYSSDAERATKKQDILNSTLKDSSQVARDVAQNTNNLDDVMKVYTASTRTATSVAKAFGKALLGTIATAAVAAVIGYVVKSLATQIDNVVHAYENARDKVSEMNQKHEEATQKVEDLTQKIEELKAKIDECKDSTTGNPVDPESYDALEQQRKQLQTNLDLQKAMAESAAHDTREAVYAQQDASSTKIISAPATVKSAGISGIYQGNQHERLQQAMDDYKTLASAIENLDSDLANGKIIQAVYDTRLAAFKEFQEKLQAYIKESGDDLNTEMDTLLNNATNEQSKDADKTKYQERIKVLSDTQQAFLNFWNLYYNNIPLITQATDDFTQSVANGDDSVKALNDAINSGDDITLTSEAYKEAANLANKYGVSVDELIKKLQALHDEQSKGSSSDDDWQFDAAGDLQNFFSNFTDSTSNCYKQTKALESAFKDMGEQGYLSSESLQALLAVYPELINNMEVENGVVSISQSILEGKFGTMKSAMIAQTQSQIDSTKVTIQQTNDRIVQYQNEIKILKELYGAIGSMPSVGSAPYSNNAISAINDYNKAAPFGIPDYSNWNNLSYPIGPTSEFNNKLDQLNSNLEKEKSKAKDAQKQLEDLEKSLAVMNGYGLSGFSGAKPKSGKSSNKGATDAQSAAIDALDKKAQALKETYEAQKKVLEDQKEAIEKVIKELEKEQTVLDGIIKTVTNRIDKEIDRLEHQWDDLKEKLEKDKDNLDSAINGANWVIEQRVKELEKANDELEDSYQPRIDALQDEIDKLNEANDAQEEAISLAQKKAALDAALAAKNVRVYREGKGFVWEADESAVKSAEEDYNDALRDKEHNDAIDKLTKEKEALEKELEDKKQANQDKIDAYNDYKEKLDDAQNAYTNAKNLEILRKLYGDNADQMILNMDQSMIDKITSDYTENMRQTDYVEDQIEQNKKLIDQLEEYKSKWEEVADAYETEQNRINTVARLGADWEEKILGQRMDVLTDFKNHYVDVLKQIKDKTKEVEDLELQIKVVEKKYNEDNAEIEKQKKELQWEKNEITRANHATGIMNVAAFERARVDEAGPEIVVRQPEAGRYTSLEVGDGVVPGNLTRRLFSAAINPEAFVESAILKRMGNVNAELTSAGSSGVHIGDINIVMNGVNDVENFGRILHQNIGSIMAQEFSKR
jgi:DNA repair exonuclease SbcCD ATPase subunit